MISDMAEKDRMLVSAAGIVAAMAIAATEVRTRIGPSNDSDVVRPS